MLLSWKQPVAAAEYTTQTRNLIGRRLLRSHCPAAVKGHCSKRMSDFWISLVHCCNFVHFGWHCWTISYIPKIMWTGEGWEFSTIDLYRCTYGIYVYFFFLCANLHKHIIRIISITKKLSFCDKPPVLWLSLSSLPPVNFLQEVCNNGTPPGVLQLS